MIGRQLYGHVPAKVVADNVGSGQAKVSAEGIQEPAAVAYPIPRKRLV
jgi:hypothetical protein